MTKKILVLNGPNLNLLGSREPHIYGSATLEEINGAVAQEAATLGLTAEFFQSNSEGALIDRIQEARLTHDAIIINPAAFTHYSYAIADALAAVSLPAIEVHLSDIRQREEFRRHSVTAAACRKQICGLGLGSYLAALRELKELLGE
ncbi:MAG: type II 3-dehydroquinate dehydratase [Clostridiales bacterium]|nr:type II 3-dehydroquinate dehydratase [Clostridiales bacterium]